MRNLNNRQWMQIFCHKAAKSPPNASKPLHDDNYRKEILGNSLPSFGVRIEFTALIFRCPASTVSFYPTARGGTVNASFYTFPGQFDAVPASPTLFQVKPAGFPVCPTPFPHGSSQFPNAPSAFPPRPTPFPDRPSGCPLELSALCAGSSGPQARHHSQFARRQNLCAGAASW